MHQWEIKSSHIRNLYNFLWRKKTLFFVNFNPKSKLFKMIFVTNGSIVVSLNNNYLLYGGESNCGGIILPVLYSGHKWLHFEAWAERSEARDLKKPRVPRVKYW